MKWMLTILLFIISLNVTAKVWRVSGTTGADADFANLSVAVNDALVLNDDTIHLESVNSIGFPLTKRLVFIGRGYLLTINTNLQANTNATSITSVLTISAGAQGSKFIGLTFNSGIGFSGTQPVAVNLVFEKCRFLDGLNFSSTGSYTNIQFRKCFFDIGTNTFDEQPANLNSFIMENCIIRHINTASNFILTSQNPGTNNIIRNNTFSKYNGINSFAFTNMYVANNIFLTGAIECSFTSCQVRNNLFTAPQTGVTVGSLSTNGNNLINQVQADIITQTGAVLYDGYYQLKAASPALGGGVMVGAYKPDCGAYGGPDPYKLSGIPGIPAIYSFTAPSNIPNATPSINVTFSTRSNN